MLYAEDMMTILKTLLAMVTAINVLFLVLVFSRRITRGSYFKAYDAARSRYFPTVCAFADGGFEVAGAAATLIRARSIPARDAVHKMLLEALDDANCDRISQLLLTLGFVDRWAAAAFGEERGRELMDSFYDKTPPGAPARNRALSLVLRLRFLAVRRAIAVFKLGQLAPDFALFFAREALRDPSFEVRSQALATLGRRRPPSGVGLLVEELHQAVAADNELSPRYIKAALSQYQPEDLRYFGLFLAHPQARVRFFVVDAIREICDRAAARGPLRALDFPAEMYQQFLEALARDPYGDVRARSAGVIKHFRTPPAAAALRSLLQDGNEYVRMWACRSIRDNFYADLIPHLLDRLADISWRVREDAANSLVGFGRPGVRAMYAYFASSSDPLACEQVAEAIQRWGLMPELVSTIAEGGEDAALAESVCRQMTVLGMTSSFKSVLEQNAPVRVRILLREMLAEAPRPRLHLSTRDKVEFIPPRSSWTAPALACAVARGD